MYDGYRIYKMERLQKVNSQNCKKCLVESGKIIPLSTGEGVKETTKESIRQVRRMGDIVEKQAGAKEIQSTRIGEDWKI